MAHELFKHYTTICRHKRAQAGEFLCDNNSIRLRHLVDICDIVEHVQGVNKNRMSKYAKVMVLERFMSEYDFEYRHGIHYMITPKDSPDSYATKYTMSYGFCDPEEDLHHTLSAGNIDSILVEFVMWYNAEMMNEAQRD